MTADLTRYPIGNDGAGRLAIWCTDCMDDLTADTPIWTEDDAAEQVTEITLANLVAHAEQHETEHHADKPTITITHNGADKQVDFDPAWTIGQLRERAVAAFALDEPYASLTGLFLTNGVELFSDSELLDDYSVEATDLLVLRPAIVRA